MGFIRSFGLGINQRVQQGANTSQSTNAIARNIGMTYNESNSDSIPYCDTSVISGVFDTDYRNYLIYKLLISL